MANNPSLDAGASLRQNPPIGSVLGAASCGHNGHKPMTGRHLDMCLLTIGWSVRELARRSGEHRTQIVRCRDGDAELPPHIAEWIEALVAAHRANPCPRRRPASFDQ